jgi:hypothetical protein
MTTHPDSPTAPTLHVDTHSLAYFAAWALCALDIAYGSWLGMSFWPAVDLQVRAGVSVLLLLSLALIGLVVRLRQAATHEPGASTLGSYIALTSFAAVFCALLLLHHVLWMYAG